MSEILVDLNLIKGNPFQPRKAEDAGAVLELAENIERNTTDDFDGLLQAPTARAAGVGYELAFGHTRLAAMRHLDRAAMRVQVRDLTDLQMFEIAVSENIKRRDLNPIEQAEAIQMYMDTFGKTSEEAAGFFGVAASTVRGSVRLLRLPEAAKEKVRSGEINTAAARGLLVVERLSGESGVEDVLERMADDAEGPLEAISNALRFSDESKSLDLEEGWVMASPFPPKHLPPARGVDRGKEEDVTRLVSFVQGGMEATEESFPAFDPDVLEKVRVLANPPGCLGCPLHAQLDGDHFCGLKACADRKQAAWWREEAASASKTLGVAVYEKSQDGPFEKLNPYNDATKKLLAEKHDDVRLMAVPGRIWGNKANLNLNEHVQVVVVGKTMEKLRKKDEKQKAGESQRSVDDDWRLTNNLASAGADFCRRFSWEVGTKAAAEALGGLTNLELAKALYEGLFPDYPEGVDEDDLEAQVKKAKKADGLVLMRRMLAMAMLEKTPRNSNKKKVVVEYAKEMGELIQAWGAKLPKDWDAQAAAYQVELETAQKEIRAAWKEKK